VRRASRINLNGHEKTAEAREPKRSEDGSLEATN